MASQNLHQGLTADVSDFIIIFVPTGGDGIAALIGIIQAAVGVGDGERYVISVSGNGIVVGRSVIQDGFLVEIEDVRRAHDHLGINRVSLRCVIGGAAAKGQQQDGN